MSKRLKKEFYQRPAIVTKLADVSALRKQIDPLRRKVHKLEQAAIAADAPLQARMADRAKAETACRKREKALRTQFDAGADGIMIHSKIPEPDEIQLFCEQYQRLSTQVPLVAVPSTYDSTTEQMLIDMGVNMVIYANHLLRSAYPAMVRTAETILSHGRAKEAAEFCMPIPELIRLIPESE